jgi:hypothetical protein
MYMLKTLEHQKTNPVRACLNFQRGTQKQLIFALILGKKRWPYI